MSFSTLLGGSRDEAANGIAVDAVSMYIAGQTTSANFPLANAFQAAIPGVQAAVVTKLQTSAPPAPVQTFPANGATGVSVTPTLTWSASTGATSYSVYLGTASPPPLVTSTGGASYSAGPLAAGNTDYWQGAANTGNGSTSSALWSFTTQPVCAYGINPATATAAATVRWRHKVGDGPGGSRPGPRRAMPRG